MSIATIDRTPEYAADVECDRLRELIAEGCRVLASRDLAPGILGHISVRVGERLVAIRCRGPRERGLAHTTGDDVRVLEILGDQAPARPGEREFTPPYELPLHVGVLYRRQDVQCVVHAHPADVVALDLAGERIRPIVGAYDIPGAALARAGIPVYPRSVLVHSPQLGAEVAEHLGAQPAVVMRGHGLTSTGAGVAEAVLRAASINQIASLSLAVLSAGGSLADISDKDVEELPDLGGSLNLSAAWRHEVARLPRPADIGP